MVPRLGEHGILTSDLLLTTFISRCLDITSKDGIGSTECWNWDAALVGGTNGLTGGETCTGVEAVKGLPGAQPLFFASFWLLTAASETHSLSPILDEEKEKEKAGAGLTAGLTAQTVECSSERSRWLADGILSNRRVAVFNGSLERVSMAVEVQSSWVWVQDLILSPHAWMREHLRQSKSVHRWMD